jgi:hypothetical protein
VRTQLCFGFVWFIIISLFTYVVEKSRAGSAKIVLPIQIKRIVVQTTSLEVRTFSGQTIALYLKIHFKSLTKLKKKRYHF